jgi:hypothetical protein
MMVARRPADLRSSEKRVLFQKMITVLKGRQDRVAIDEILEISHGFKTSDICKQIF